MTYQNHDSELHFVNCLVQYPQSISQTVIEPSELVDPDCREIYGIMLAMHKAGETVDLVTVAMKLDTPMKILKDKWCSEYSSPLFIRVYEEKIREMSVLRALDNAFKKKSTARDIINTAKKLKDWLINPSQPTLAQDFEDYKVEWAKKQKRIKETGGVGIITGFPHVDKRAWLYPGHLIVLGARTSMGKSALALNWAVASAMYGQRTIFFSVEMDKQSLLDRILSQLSGSHVTKFKHAEAEYGLKYADEHIKNLKHLSIHQSPKMTSETVCSIARDVFVKENKLDLIVVDYLQYLRDPVKSTNNDRIGEITSKFKSLALELNCAVLLLSQVNRSAANENGGMPKTHQLRDSGSIEQDADTVLFLNREDRDSRTAVLTVAKARDGVAEEAVRLTYAPELTLFKEMQS